MGKSQNQRLHSASNHVITVWIENGTIKWYLGLVEKSIGDNFLVSYLTKTDIDGKFWKFPEKEDLWETTKGQILQKNVTVEYFGTVTFECKIVSVELIKAMNEKIKKF